MTEYHIEGTVTLTPTEPVPQPPSEPKYDFRAVYDIGNKQANPQLPWCCTDFDDPKASLGITHVALPIGNATVAAKLKEKGLKSGGWYCGVWNNSTGAWTNNDQYVTNVVNAVKNEGVGNHYYLADEPNWTMKFRDALEARIKMIKGLDPAAVCVICDYTWSGRTQFGHWATDTPSLGELWVSGAYPVLQTSLGQPGRYDKPTQDFQASEAEAAKKRRSSLVIRGIVGMHNDVYAAVTPDAAYSGKNCVIPSFPGATKAAVSTENQIQLQVDGYRASSAFDGLVAFSYGIYPETGPPSAWTGYLRNRPDLCAEMAKQFLRS